MYFPDRGCVHTLLTLYVYATVYLYVLLFSLVIIGELLEPLSHYSLVQAC